MANRNHAQSGHPLSELTPSSSTSSPQSHFQSSPSASYYSSRPQQLAHSSPAANDPSKMIGGTAPWNPNTPGIASYPPEETFAAEYRAFLDTYPGTTGGGGAGRPPVRQPTAPPSGAAAANGSGLGYGLDEKEMNRRVESRDSSSATTSPYGTANAIQYASDAYPPYEYPAGLPQDLISSSNDQHQRHQHQHQQPHRRSTVDSQAQQAQMYSLSPESFSTGSVESPPHTYGGMNLSQQQQQQYFPQDQYYANPYPGQRSSQSWSHQNQSDYTYAQQQQQQQQHSPQQHQGHSTYANHARPAASTNQYVSAGYHKLPTQITGVAPSQISSTPGGGAMSAQVGSHGQQQPQANVQNRAIAKPVSRKETNSSFAPMLPNARVASGGSQQNSTFAKPPVKPPQPAKLSSKKRQRVEEEEEDSDSSDDYWGDGDPQTGQQAGTQGAGGKPQRLPGACAPCKRLKMKCVFPDGPGECCQRCKNSGRASQCIVGPRKPRQPSNKKEMLLQKLREQDGVIKSKDAVIKSLLEQIQNPHIRISLKESPAISASAAAAMPELQNAQHEDKPIDKAILEWIERAEASIKSTPGYRLTDARVLDEGDESSDSELLGRDQMSPGKSSVSDGGRSAGRLSNSLLAPEAASGSHSIKSSPKLHSLPLEETPVGLLAELSLRDHKEKEKEAQSRRSRSRSKSRSASGAEESESHTGLGSSIDGGEGDEDALGVAGKDYFQPAPTSNAGLKAVALDKKNIPEIMTSGLISPAEVDKLFKVFFDKLNVFVSILDPVLHTPATTFGRCPFLFTVVCAISSRYYTERPELYSIAMHFARRAAASSLIEGAKSVELCQAYILMSVYSMPSRRWEDAREWLYLGLAIRMAIDLNLHVKSTSKILNETHERELLNRTRTWLICYNLDRSTSAQLGKPASIRPDPIIRSCNSWGKQQAWWRSSPVNDPFDLHLCAYTDLLSSIIGQFQDRVYWDPKTETTGLRTDLDLVKVAFEFDDRLLAWNSKTAVSFATYSDANNSQCAYRVQLLPFYVNYMRLVMLSLGFQQSMRRMSADPTTKVNPELVDRCITAACGVIKTIVDNLAPTGYLRYAPDGHFVFSSFASAFLVKILRPEHAELIDAERRASIIELVERFVDTLKSPKIAVDVRHTPTLYARFLAGLLAKYKPDTEGADSQTNADTDATRSDTHGLRTPPIERHEVQGSNDLSGGRTASQAFGHGMMHKASPSIEISPPAPEASSGMAPPPSRTIYDPLALDQALYPPQPLGDDASYTGSTVHAASTVHGGSQYGGGDVAMAENDYLAPMMAMDNPVFWGSMMLPGMSWPAEEPAWSTMNLDMDDLSQTSGEHLASSQDGHFPVSHGYHHQ